MRLRKQRNAKLFGTLAAVGAIGVSSSLIFLSSGLHQKDTMKYGNDNLMRMRQLTWADAQTSSTLTIPSNTQGSSNWSGYIATPSSSATAYTNVTGSWVVPTVSGDEGSVAAQWIGLGGANSQDLLQVGTTEQVINGQEEADVFWEKLPATAQNVLTIPVGSTVSASIAQGTGSNWKLTVNYTTPSGETASKVINVSLSSAYAAAIEGSAEWISEDPSDANNSLYPLANAGTVNFTNATVNGQAINASGNQVVPIALVDDFGNILIAPSQLGSDGTTFSTTTTGSSGTTIPTPGGSGSGWGQGWPQFPYGHGHHRQFPSGSWSWGGYGVQSYGHQSYGGGATGGWQVEFYWS